ncbi:hypothetical protein AB0F96_20690 [Streptomyces sp. NPDC023998]|uniref:hypothetical protein n=1 Tax=Streptomyces sp. NPDC023998 TaxID=3154597 RepID=UPI0033CC23C6
MAYLLARADRGGPARCRPAVLSPGSTRPRPAARLATAKPLDRAVLTGFAELVQAAGYTGRSLTVAPSC